MLLSRTTLMNAEQMRRLDQLFGAALLDDSIRQRLVSQRDDALLADFGLSSDLQSRLSNIPASSLVELAQGLLFSFNRRP
jgi:hypothetical protein